MSDCRVPMRSYGKPTISVEITFEDGSRWFRKIAANGREVRMVRVEGARYVKGALQDHDTEWMNE